MFDRNTRGKNRSNTTFLSIVGIAMFALIFISVYLQWNSFLTEHENDELSRKLKVRNNELLMLDQASQDIQFQYRRLRSLIQSKNLSVVHIPGNMRDFKKATLMWDRLTQRSALLFDELILPPDTSLCIWWKGNRQLGWQLAATLTKVTPDTVYTRFDLPSFNRVNELDLQFINKNSDHPTIDDGRKIGHVSLGETSVNISSGSPK